MADVRGQARREAEDAGVQEHAEPGVQRNVRVRSPVGEDQRGVAERPSNGL